MNSISATKILLFLFVGLVMTFVSTTIIGNVYFPDAMDVTTDSAYLSMLNDLQNFLGLAFSALLGALAERIPQGRESK